MSGPDNENRHQPGPPPGRVVPVPGTGAGKGLGMVGVLQGCLGCGVVIVDGGGQITSLTGQARKLLGLPLHQTGPISFDDLPAALHDAVASARLPGQGQTEGVYELRTCQQKSCTVNISAECLAPGGKESSVAVVLYDLGPLRLLEQRLEQLDRLANIGTLAAAMAHEIRNALVAGKTFVDLLLEKNQDAELAGLVQREMGRIDGIVGRMLKFGGSARPELSQVRLHDLLEHSLRLVQPKLEDSQVSLTCSFQAVADTVAGDERQLQQAFVNLLLNALDAMGTGGSLAVATELVPPTNAAGRAQLRVTIKDSGPGIPPELIGRLFEPFFTTKPNGTGLGLSITRRIILDHGGDIGVDSPPGQGTAFHILLPASA